MRDARPTTLVFNLLAGVLVLLFCANFVNDLLLGEVYDSLWICHVSLLLLALGLVLNKAGLIQVALLWIVPGSVLWFMDSIQNHLFSLTTTLSHVGGLIVGFYAIRQTRTVRLAWLYALGFFLCLQLVSRWTTPPVANVNIAHGVWDGWQALFDVYWQYWLFTTGSAIVGLWLLEKFLRKMFPAHRSFE